MTCFSVLVVQCRVVDSLRFQPSPLLIGPCHKSTLVHIHILHPFLTISFCTSLSVYTYHNNKQRVLYTCFVLPSWSLRILHHMHLSKSIYYIKIAFLFFLVFVPVENCKKRFVHALFPPTIAATVSIRIYVTGVTKCPFLVVLCVITE